MNIGDIVCLKVTGEKVYVLDLTADTASVRRPTISETGSIYHIVESFNADELESMEDFAQRQIKEVFIKAQAQRDLEKLDRELDDDPFGEDDEPEDTTPPANGSSTGDGVN